MSYGITTSRAHINTLTHGAREATELNLSALIDWQDFLSPSFAGRYFVGTKTRAEVDQDLGFCLWGHGEGIEPSINHVVPMQRADSARQSATGLAGADYGATDAYALGIQVQQCLTVGDLTLPADSQFVLVFLEVAPGTVLSFDYWLAWATTMHAVLIDPDPNSDQARVDVQPLLPAITCGFALDDRDGGDPSSYVPESLVRDCLNHDSPGGRRHLCYGLWSTTPIVDPVFGSFVQTDEDWRVPVYYARTFDGPAGTPMPGDAPVDTHQTLPLITLDDVVDGDPLKYSLTPTLWSAFESPTQCGVDTNRDLTDEGVCIHDAEIVVRQLPSAYSVDGIDVAFEGEDLDPNPVRAHGSFAIRYYRPQGRTSGRIDAAEAEALSRADVLVATVFQDIPPRGSGYKGLLDHYRIEGQGKVDGAQAFEYAATTIKQPPYTPIYFAVDFPPGQMYGREGDMWLAPSMEHMVQYFKDIHDALLEHLETHPAYPYYVGAYGQASLCEALYRAGAASHFWQPWPPTWGYNWKIFPHANAWQVLLDVTKAHSQYPFMWNENTAIQDCANVDLNVAWGDPGGWSVYGDDR